MLLNEIYTLYNGVKIPKLGVGTWKIDDEAFVQVITNALEIW